MTISNLTIALVAMILIFGPLGLFLFFCGYAFWVWAWPAELLEVRRDVR